MNPWLTTKSCALAFVLVTGPALASDDDATESEVPSAELLEFLAEFDGVEDDETFDLLIENGLNDYAESQPQEVLESAENPESDDLEEAIHE